MVGWATQPLHWKFSERSHLGYPLPFQDKLLSMHLLLTGTVWPTSYRRFCSVCLLHGHAPFFSQTPCSSVMNELCMGFLACTAQTSHSISMGLRLDRSITLNFFLLLFLKHCFGDLLCDFGSFLSFCWASAFSWINLYWPQGLSSTIQTLWLALRCHADFIFGL